MCIWGGPGAYNRWYCWDGCKPVLVLSVVPDTSIKWKWCIYPSYHHVSHIYLWYDCSGELWTGLSGVLLESLLEGIHWLPVPGTAGTWNVHAHTHTYIYIHIHIYKDSCYWEPKPTHPTCDNTHAEWVDTTSSSTPASRWIWIGDHSVKDIGPICHVEAGISKVPHLSLEHYKKTGQVSWRGYHCSDNFATEILIFTLQEVLMTQISLMGSLYHRS